jgi:uncharacterized protein with PQ loop repeat
MKNDKIGLIGLFIGLIALCIGLFFSVLHYIDTKASSILSTIIVSSFTIILIFVILMIKLFYKRKE